MSSFDGLTSLEMSLQEFGSDKEKVRYVVEMLDRFSGVHERATLYKAAAYCNKKFGFDTSVKAARLVTEATDSSIFAKTVYSCRAYEESINNKRSDVEVTDSFSKSSSVNAKTSDLLRRRKLLASPINGLFEMLCKEEITKEEYESSKSTEEAAADLIRSKFSCDCCE